MKRYILTVLVTSFFFSCNENSINYNQIDSMINNEIEANNIPGAVVLIGDEKGINYQKSYGIKNPETNEEFNEEFIDLARSVYKLNDERFAIKNEINKTFDSEIQEQKEYENYS